MSLIFPLGEKSLVLFAALSDKVTVLLTILLIFGSNITSCLCGACFNLCHQYTMLSLVSKQERAWEEAMTIVLLYPINVCIYSKMVVVSLCISLTQGLQLVPLVALSDEVKGMLTMQIRKRDSLRKINQSNTQFMKTWFYRKTANSSLCYLHLQQILPDNSAQFYMLINNS